MKKTLFVAGLATILLAVASGLCLIIDLTGEKESMVSNVAEVQICAENEGTDSLVPVLYVAEVFSQNNEN